ncbi:MAG: hypothetical protein ABH827_05950 [bacterium]
MMFSRLLLIFALMFGLVATPGCGKKKDSCKKEQTTEKKAKKSKKSKKAKKSKRSKNKKNKKNKEKNEEFNFKK